MYIRALLRITRLRYRDRDELLLKNIRETKLQPSYLPYSPAKASVREFEMAAPLAGGAAARRHQAHHLAVQVAGLAISIAVDTSAAGERTVQISVHDPLLGPAPDRAVQAELHLPPQPFEVPSSGSPASSAGEDGEPPLPVEAAYLERRIAAGGGLSARGRIRRGFLLGVADRRILIGQEMDRSLISPGDRLPGLRNTVYAILRGINCRDTWTRDLAVYIRLVGRTAEGTFAAGTVSRAFPTQSEATAYFLGSALPELPAERTQ